jgi:hypothetical protein
LTRPNEKDEELLVHGDAPQRVTTNEPSIGYAAWMGMTLPKGAWRLPVEAQITG